MRRLTALGPAVAAAAVFSAAAHADVGVYLRTHVVSRYGVIRGHGDGSGMPVYLVPAKLAPKRYRCSVNGYTDAICEPKSKRAPGPPFVFLGRLRRTANIYQRQTFAFRVPAGVRPGLYKVFLYCHACGGSLIVSGLSYEGGTLRIV